MPNFKKLASCFKEVAEHSGDGFDFDAVEDDGSNRVQKEAYICKRMKITRPQLYELCVCTGIDAIYDELRRKGGAR